MSLSFRCRIRAAVATVGVALVVGSVLAGPAQADPQPSPPPLPQPTAEQLTGPEGRQPRPGTCGVGSNSGVSLCLGEAGSPSVQTRPAGAQAAAGACSTTWDGQRFDMCASFSQYLNIYDPKTGAVLGEWPFETTQRIAIQGRLPTFTESVTVVMGAPTAKISPTTLSLTATCGGSCVAVGDLVGPVGAGTTLSGTITYEGTVPPGGYVFAQPAYSILFSNADGPSTPGTWSANSVRCDNAPKTGSSAGCVNPFFTPTMTSMQALPVISAGISRIQGAGGYGVPGGTPLQRSTNDAARDANRAAACGSAVRPADVPDDYTCDEYPFATTYQGAAYVSPPGSGITWAPQNEQSSQGGLVSQFYTSNRLLDGEQFFVLV